MKIIFVDGYNVLNSWPILKKVVKEDFDGGRKKLIDILHNYGTYENVRIILVFDGYKVEGNLESKNKINNNLVIVYTKSGETADSYIERNVHDLGRRAEICVVTSDSLEQQTIFQRGAIRIATLEFYSEVMSIEEKVRKKTENSHISAKNHLQDNIDDDILKKLEKIRRSH